VATKHVRHHASRFDISEKEREKANTMSAKQVRWGVMGAAGIARKNWQAIKYSGNGQLAAVASRSRERAEQFITDCQSYVPFASRPEACGSYEELLARRDIDAVYIPLPTGMRKEWVIRAADAGKHVLAEKPVGCDAAEVEEMLAACQRNNVQFMDGVMFMHSARLDKLRETLDDGQSVGRVRRITSQFSFAGPEEFHQSNIRAHSVLEPLGCLGDLGWYNIRFTLWAMKYVMPERVTGRLLVASGRNDSPDAVPMDFSAELFFPGDVSASYYCSFLTENQQWANISGSKGYVHLRDFVLPFYGGQSSFDVTNAVLIARSSDTNMIDRTRKVSAYEFSNSYDDSQETRLFRRFGELVLSDKIDASWGEIALRTQLVLDACLTSARQGGREVALAPRPALT
jgi:predicted dehydrogenase